MKLNCPKCKKEIKYPNINVNEGFANCTSCNEFFKIADFLRGDEEIRRIQKPFSTNIEITTQNDALKINMPHSSNTINNGSLFFSFILFAMNVSVFLNQSYFYLIFLTPALLVCIGWVLFELKGTTMLTIDKSFLKVKWSIFGIGHEKTRSTNNLVKISEDTVYTQNYQPVYGIGLFFKYEKDIKFGSRLIEAERKWLIGELYELKFKLVTEREKLL